jgi:hypothetical protein
MSVSDKPLRYRINEAPEAAGGLSITCLECGRTSCNPTDVEMCYCGYCHKFLRDPGDKDSTYHSSDEVKVDLERAAEDDGLV